MDAHDAHDSRDAEPRDPEGPTDPPNARGSANPPNPGEHAHRPGAGEPDRLGAGEPDRLGASEPEYLTAFALAERLAEEINRAGRHGTALSCVLLEIESVAVLAGLPGGPELAERTWTYVGLALARELRRFDRVGRQSGEHLLIVLPGADEPRAEIVARRLLRRLRAIKLEIDGQRRALRTNVGLVVWREGMGAGLLLERARAAVGRGPDAD